MAAVSLGADEDNLDGHILFMVQSWISINQITVTAGLKKNALVKTWSYFWQW